MSKQKDKQELLEMIKSVKTRVPASRMKLYQAHLDVLQGELLSLAGLTKQEIIETYLEEAVSYAKEIDYKISAKGLFVLTQNAKLSKQGDGQWLAAGVEFASGLKSGNAVCLRAIELGLSCLSNCIVYAGNGRHKNVFDKRVKRTRFFFEQPALFIALLLHDLEKLKLEALIFGKKLAIRLNVFSDLPWEDLAGFLFGLYPEIQFYDYTKEGERLLAKPLPPNYHITASYHEHLSWVVVEQLIEKGINVAAVFQASKKDMPYRHKNFPVVNGDEHDFRFLDPKGVIVGLARKGKLSKENHKGFMLIPNKAYQPTKSKKKSI